MTTLVAPTCSPVLLIDDDTDFLQVMAAALRKRGCEVHTAADAVHTETLRCSPLEPASVVVDLRLGRDNGLQLLQGLRERWPDAALIMLTGYGSIATAVEAMKRGADDYVVKPVHADELLSALQKQHDAMAADEKRAQEPFASDGLPNDVLPDDSLPNDVLPNEPLRLAQLEWEHIQRVLNEHEGNISAAARALGIHRRTLQRRLLKAPRPR